MKHVIIFVQSRLEKYGGFEDFLVCIAKNMPSYGMRGCFIFTDCKTRKVKDLIESYGSEVYIKREPWNSWIFSLKLIFDKNFLKSHILHIHFWLSRESIILLFFAKLLRKKVFINYQEDSVVVRKYHRYFSRYKILSLFSDSIISASDERKKFIKKYFNIHNCLTIHYGINTKNIDSFFSKKLNKNIIILCVASITRRKGIKYLLKSVPLVINEFNNVEFYFVGSGKGRKSYNKDECDDLVTELDIGQYVKFFGTIEHVYPMMHQCDIFVLPSLDESFGIVLAEAMAARKPVISTKVGAVGEVVKNGETGILVPPSDPNALAKAILELLRDEEKMHEMGLAGRGRVERMFSLQSSVQKLLELYSRTLGSRFP